MMRSIKATDVLNMSEQEVMAMTLSDEVAIEVEFLDKKIVTNWVRLLFSRVCWRVFLVYGVNKIYSRHEVSAVIKGDSITAKTHTKLLMNIIKDVRQEIAPRDFDIGELSTIVFYVGNELHNIATANFSEYQGSIDILDYIQITHHPKIEEFIAKAGTNEKAINDINNFIKNEVRTNPDFKDNPLRKSLVAGTIGENQFLQCVGVRGIVTDIDSFPFRYSIMRGFVNGLRSLYDHAIESRSAAKSLIFSKHELSNTEYFSRRLQQMCIQFANIHEEDCGSTHYIDFPVRGVERDPNTQEVTYPGDLQNLVGKWYLDETSGNLKIIKSHNTELIGKTIKIRDLFGCRHTDRHGACAKCVGDLSLYFYKSTIAGHQATVTLIKDISQKVLSTKHYDGSATIGGIVVEPQYRPYIRLAPNDENSYCITKELKGNLKLVIRKQDAANLIDINEVDDVKLLNIYRTSHISKIVLQISTDTTIDSIPMDVSFNRREASLTYYALSMIKGSNNWDVDKRGNYIIDITDWDRDEPILVMPMVQYNMADFGTDVAKLLESTVSESAMRDKAIDPYDLLFRFYDLVSVKQPTNLAVLEIIMMGILIESAENNRYHMPKPYTERGVGVMVETMQNRSMAAAMAFQGHTGLLLNPASFLVTDRPDHPYDALLLPNEVISGQGKYRQLDNYRD